MTPEELARAIHARHARTGRKGEPPIVPWDKLSHQAQRRLVAAAERLRRAAWAGDPPSRGISAADD